MASPRRHFHSIFLFLISTVAVSCTQTNERAAVPDVPERRPGVLIGYLEREQLPDSYALLPHAPVDAATLALDEAIAARAVSLRGGPRWTLATEDADLSFPAAAGTFSCAVYAPISEQETPYLYMLLRRTLTDAGLSTYAAKDHYQRARPFVANQEAICTPAIQSRLANDGSYPSGHVAIGWAWALILSELDPENANPILARGRAFGESRSVCNVHWYSDIIHGRMMGAATVARLHAHPDFLRDLNKARTELQAVRAKGLPPSRDCGAESEAMAVSLFAENH